jgi:glutathione S-transferase
MLKVWGRKNSSNVQKVMWAIGELGLAYERIDMGMEFGGNDQPDYLALNPNGLVPTLQDGDLILWESNTIIRYLANRYGTGTLEPADPKTRALASQWMDWQISVFLPAASAAFFGLVRTPPEQRDLTAIARSQTQSVAAATIFDAELSRHSFTAGDTFSMADIPMGIRIYRFRQLVPQRPPFPNIERWYASIEKRSAFHEHVGSVPLT